MVQQLTSAQARFGRVGRNLEKALVAGIALLVGGCAAGPAYNWGWYILSPTQARGQANLEFLLAGLWPTIAVSAAALAVSVPIGALVGIAGANKHRGLQLFNRSYVEIVRAVPGLVLVLWVYYGLPVVFGIQFGIFAAGVLALGLSDSAFQAEIFRAGIQSIAPGQIDGAKSLGLNRFLIMRLVVLPQAVRNILPALGNQFVYMLKMSSILSIIGFPELTRRSNELVVTEYRPLEIYTFLVIEYLILILVASWLMRRLEHALNPPLR
jgi:His/Glu/Gln/Arg/opine family amino acid ABC transporter permease subunit